MFLAQMTLSVEDVPLQRLTSSMLAEVFTVASPGGAKSYRQRHWPEIAPCGAYAMTLPQSDAPDRVTTSPQFSHEREGEKLWPINLCDSRI